MHRVEIKS